MQGRVSFLGGFSVSVEYLKKQIVVELKYISSKRRSFRRGLGEVFLKRFLQVGNSRIEEVDAYWEDRTTLGMQHWFKAASFILRTNEGVHEWIPKNGMTRFPGFETDRVRMEEISGRKSVRLPGPIQQTLLASFYILNLRKMIRNCLS